MTYIIHSPIHKHNAHREVLLLRRRLGRGEFDRTKTKVVHMSMNPLRESQLRGQREAQAEAKALREELEKIKAAGEMAAAAVAVVSSSSPSSSSTAKEGKTPLVKAAEAARIAAEAAAAVKAADETGMAKALETGASRSPFSLLFFSLSLSLSLLLSSSSLSLSQELPNPFPSFLLSSSASPVQARKGEVQAKYGNVPGCHVADRGVKG